MAPNVQSLCLTRPIGQIDSYKPLRPEIIVTLVPVVAKNEPLNPTQKQKEGGSSAKIPLSSDYLGPTKHVACHPHQTEVYNMSHVPIDPPKPFKPDTPVNWVAVETKNAPTTPSEMVFWAKNDLLQRPIGTH